MTIIDKTTGITETMSRVGKASLKRKWCISQNL